MYVVVRCSACLSPRRFRQRPGRHPTLGRLGHRTARRVLLYRHVGRWRLCVVYRRAMTEPSQDNSSFSTNAGIASLSQQWRGPCISGHKNFTGLQRSVVLKTSSLLHDTQLTSAGPRQTCTPAHWGSSFHSFGAGQDIVPMSPPHTHQFNYAYRPPSNMLTIDGLASKSCPNWAFATTGATAYHRPPPPPPQRAGVWHPPKALRCRPTL